MKASEEKKKKMREYSKTHRKQFNEYQRKYINKLKEEGKKIPTTNYKARIDKAIDYIEQEKIRLAKEVSNIYKDTLDRTRLVNEDIYNELDDVLDILKGSDNNDN